MATSKAYEKASGYDVEVVSEYPSDFNCSICTLLIKDAVNGCANHVFCKLCIDKHVEFGITLKENVLCPGGCRLPIKATKPQPNNVIDRMINKLKVKCSHDSCTWLGELLDFVQTHKESCDYSIQSCHNEGCKVTFLKKESSQHDFDCVYKLIECLYCRNNVQIKQKETHELLCSNQMVNCLYYDIGCQIKVPRKDTNLHENEFSVQHTHLIYENSKEKFLMKDIEILLLQDEITELKKQVIVLEKTSKEVKNITKKNKGMILLQNEITELKKQVNVLEKTSKVFRKDKQDREKKAAKEQGDIIQKAVIKQIIKPDKKDSCNKIFIDLLLSLIVGIGCQLTMLAFTAIAFEKVVGFKNLKHRVDQNGGLDVIITIFILLLVGSSGYRGYTSAIKYISTSEKKVAGKYVKTSAMLNALFSPLFMPFGVLLSYDIIVLKNPPPENAILVCFGGWFGCALLSILGSYVAFRQSIPEAVEEQTNKPVNNGVIRKVFLGLFLSVLVGNFGIMLAFKLGACETIVTQYASNGGDNGKSRVHFLDRHSLQCSSGYVLTSFQLQNKLYGQEYRYNGNCCSNDKIEGGITYERTTAFSSDESGKFTSLTNQDVFCTGDSLLSGFKLDTYSGSISSSLRYEYKCSTANRYDCTIHYTGFDVTMDYMTVLLDRHNVKCPGAKALAGFQLESRFSRVRYTYICCSY